MHEIREGEEEENVSTTGGGGGSRREGLWAGQGVLGGGVGGVGNLQKKSQKIKGEKTRKRK